MNSIDWTSIGMRIRILRKQKNLTQEQVANKLHITSQYFGYIERGQRPISLELLYAITQIFDCNFCDILPCKKQPYNQDKQLCIEMIQNLNDEEIKFVRQFITTYTSMQILNMK